MNTNSLGTRELSDEQAGVFRNRYRQARNAGLNPDDAMEFAHSIEDVSVLRKLVLFGATAEQIAQIVL